MSFAQEMTENRRKSSPALLVMQKALEKFAEESRELRLHPSRRSSLGVLYSFLRNSSRKEADDVGGAVAWRNEKPGEHFHLLSEKHASHSHGGSHSFPYDVWKELLGNRVQRQKLVGYRLLSPLASLDDRLCASGFYLPDVPFQACSDYQPRRNRGSLSPGHIIWNYLRQVAEIARISPTNDRQAPGFQVALTADGWQTFLARQNRCFRFWFHFSMIRLGDFSPCIVLPKVLLPLTASDLIAQIEEHFLHQILEYEIILQQGGP